MRKLLVASALAISVFSAAPVSAQTATQDISITATVPGFCSIAGGFSPAALNTTIPISSNGTVTTTVQNFTINTVVCNKITNVVATSQSGGVKSATAAASGFTNIIDYTGVATFGSVSSTINTVTVATAVAAEAGNTAATAGAASGDLTVAITPAQPSLPLMAASDYSDILRITLTPQ